MSLSTIVIVLILVAIGIFSVKNYVKNVTGGCCGGGDTEKKIKVRDRNPAHYTRHVKIGVDGMTCDHCKMRVENALNGEDGVWAEVDLKDESATVRMKNEISEDKLRNIISRAGYIMTYMENVV